MDFRETCCYLPFFTRLPSFSTVLWIFYDKVLLLFILYLTIRYFTQLSPLLSELTPSSEQSFRFSNYPTSLLGGSSAVLYSPLRRTNIIQTTTSTEIDPIIHAFISVWNILDHIEETSDHQFFLIQYRSQ